MNQNEKSGSVRRRQLMKGAAWAAPSAAVAVAAPAYAASPCKPSIRFSGGSAFDKGTIVSNGTTATTTQTADFGGETYVDNLPAGVKVQTIDYKFWIQNRINANDGTLSPGPGLYWMGNTSYAAPKGTCSDATTCRFTWSKANGSGAPTSGSGFSTIVTTTSNLTETNFPGGEKLKAWDLNMSWSAGTDQNINSRYTAGTGTCQNFDSGPSSRFKVTYTGVRALTKAQENTATASYLAFVIITVKLSNNTTLTYTSKELH